MNANTENKKKVKLLHVVATCFIKWKLYFKYFLKKNKLYQMTVNIIQQIKINVVESHLCKLTTLGTYKKWLFKEGYFSEIDHTQYY